MLDHDHRALFNTQMHLNHLMLKGLRPKTVEAYSRAIRRMVEYFTDLIESR